MTRAADDFDAIAKAVKAMHAGASPEDSLCLTCDGSGFVYSSYQAVGSPNFEECRDCGNPERMPSP